MLCLVVLLGGFLGGVQTQFMLYFGTTKSPTVTPAPWVPGVYSPNCLDTLDNCARYGKKSCIGPYEEWAKKKCPNYCGICMGPAKTPPPCKDTIDHCDTYPKSTCSDPKFKGWAEDNCRYFCRLCSFCKDKVDCRLYGKGSCTGQYATWAKDNCPAFCGFCSGFATPSPVCADTNPECNLYDKSTCTDPSFKLWVEDNCQKYCGKCGAGGGQAANTPYPMPPLPGK